MPKSLNIRETSLIKLCVSITLPIILMACAHGDNKATENTELNSAATSEERQDNAKLNFRSITNVDQIGSSANDFMTAQIRNDADAEQLTVDQLKTYADRCAPDASVSADGVDCSDLSLRVKKLFRSDDKVSEALFMLDRLGRSGSTKSVSDELSRNVGDLSFSAQAIASGALANPAPAEVPTEPVASDLENFLNTNGLGVEPGSIVVRPNGGG